MEGEYSIGRIKYMDLKDEIRENCDYVEYNNL